MSAPVFYLLLLVLIGTGVVAFGLINAKIRQAKAQNEVAALVRADQQAAAKAEAAASRRRRIEQEKLKKGEEGEAFARRQLKLLPAATYAVFHDIYLTHPDRPDELTQLDHVIVSRFGAYVVETKNIGDQLRCPSDILSDWTRTGRDGKPEEMYSPVKQNEMHARAMAQQFNLGRTAVIDLVYLVGTGAVTGTPGDRVVTDRFGIVAKVREHEWQGREMITEIRVTEIVQGLRMVEQKITPADKKRHKELIHSRHGS